MSTTEITIKEVQTSDLININEWKAKQQKVVEENPFIEITDNASFAEAKKARTNLVSARTEIEKQDKVIASKLKELRSKTQEITAELISITKPFEEKQQEEVKRFEAIKEAEKLEKARIEQERISNIKTEISQTISSYKEQIKELKFENIESFENNFRSNLEIFNKSKFQEFVSDYETQEIEVLDFLQAKISQLRDDEVRRIEREEIEAEKKRLEEQRKLDEENQAKIKAEQEAEAERIKQEQAEAQRKIDEERKAIEAEKKRLQDEENARLAKIKAEQEAKELEELKLKQEAERVEKEKIEAKRLESLRPDKEKINSFLEDLTSKIQFPDLEDEALDKELKQFLLDTHQSIRDFQTKIQNFK
ncbi:hypothetical protein HX096_12170 [Empedobacter falsenii]|uniref:hypothetical protein n=1 Tax=Empedobacter falsenii TaxID=343874 RepID=UPI002576B37E|nr:hypothetical protein [Empedobacter falsenii]MDM1548609.1 hypothetical protein [Empedobacter falsenii]